MDQLSAKEQEKIKKMSDAYLVNCLTRAGVSIDELEIMDRPTMFERWANVVLAGGDKAPAAAATPTVSVAPAGYDVAFEREKLAFEKQKWEADRDAETRQKDFEKQKWEAEMRQKEADRDAEMRQKDAEIQQREADREAQTRLKEAEMRQRDSENERNDEMRRNQLRLQEEQLRLEQRKTEGKGFKIKQ